MKRLTTLLVTAVGLGLTLSPAAADAARKSNDVPIAVWALMADDTDRAQAGPVYDEIAAALSAVDGVRPDRDRVFEPFAKPSEGVIVAQRTANRWLDAAWIAYQRQEWSVARSLIDDAIALVEGYPHERLPDGLRRELQLLKARTDIRGGNDFTGREALRAAMTLDPSWEANRRWEPSEIVELYEAVRDETIGVPPARVRITSSVRGATVLVGGVERGRSQGSEPIELLLPPGTHEVTARLAGHASHTHTVFLTPRQELDLDFFLEVKNTARFQEQLEDALVAPAQQRRTGIWTAMKLAVSDIEATGVLSARFDAPSETLQLGLFFPGRQGWAFYRSIPLGGPTQASEVEAAIEELLLIVDSTLHPQTDGVATRD